jgi:O-antigen/teichoic acid export membrane protein
MSRVRAGINTVIEMLRTPGERRKFLVGAASVFVLQIAGVAAAYLMQALLANLAGSQGFGDYIYAYNWARLLAMFGGFGLTLSVLKFLPGYIADEKWGQIRGVINAFSLITLGVSSILAVLAIGVFTIFPPEDIDITTLYVGLLITPLISISYLYIEVLRGMGFVALAYGPINVGQNVLMMVAISVVFLLTGSLTNVNAISLLGLVTIGIVIFQLINIFRKMPVAAKSAKAVYETGVWIRTSLPMLLIRSFDLVMDRVDVLMVGFLLGAIPTGIYAVASRTASLAMFPLVAVNAVTAPRIAPLYNQGKMEELSNLVKRATLISMAVSLVACVGIILFSYPLLKLFGEDFVEGQTTLFILTAAQFVNASVGPVGFLMSMTGHEKLNGRIYAVVTAINITLNYYFLVYTDLGIEGVALSTGISLALRNIWLYIEVRRRLHISTLPVSW